MSASIHDAAAYEQRNGFPLQPVRCHHLKAVGRSPAHARLSLGGAEDAEESAAQSLGSTVHALIEGRKDVVVYPGGSRRGKEWEAFALTHQGKRIVLAKEMEAASAMAEAIVGDPKAARLVCEPRVQREQSLYFDYLGRACRATPDLRARRSGWFAELKTTRCADPERFRWDALRLSYHVQVAMQLEAIRANGGKPKAAFIIAVESAPPWPVTVMRVTEDSLERGARQLRLWMERLLACEASGAWPGYCQSVVDLQIGEKDIELVYGKAAEAEVAP